MDIVDKSVYNLILRGYFPFSMWINCECCTAWLLPTCEISLIFCALFSLCSATCQKCFWQRAAQPAPAVSNQEKKKDNPFILLSKFPRKFFSLSKYYDMLRWTRWFLFWMYWHAQSDHCRRRALHDQSSIQYHRAAHFQALQHHIPYFSTQMTNVANWHQN